MQERRSCEGAHKAESTAAVTVTYPNNSREPGFQEFSETFLGALDQLSAAPHAPNYTDENIYVNAKYGVVPAAFFCQTRGCMIQYAAPPILLLRGRCCQNWGRRLARLSDGDDASLDQSIGGATRRRRTGTSKMPATTHPCRYAEKGSYPALQVLCIAWVNAHSVTQTIDVVVVLNLCPVRHPKTSVVNVYVVPMMRYTEISLFFFFIVSRHQISSIFFHPTKAIYVPRIFTGFFIQIDQYAWPFNFVS